MPNVVLEAMASGKAVVATPVGGELDVLKDGENGRFVAVKDVNSLTGIIQEIMSDTEMQKHLGRSARQTVESKVTLQSEWNGNLFLYRKLGLKV